MAFGEQIGVSSPPSDKMFFSKCISQNVFFKMYFSKRISQNVFLKVASYRLQLALEHNTSLIDWFSLSLLVETFATLSKWCQKFSDEMFKASVIAA